MDRDSDATLIALLLLNGVCLVASAALGPEAAAMNQPITPFRIADHLYYVGASDVASYLLVTPAGDILIDGGFAETAPLIESNIATLGFRVTDVEWLLNGHAHPDHAGSCVRPLEPMGETFCALARNASASCLAAVRPTHPCAAFVAFNSPCYARLPRAESRWFANPWQTPLVAYDEPCFAQSRKQMERFT